MKDDRYEWYFAYASNLDRNTFCGRRRIQPRDAKTCYLSGFSLAFNLAVGPSNRGVANLIRDPKKLTWGVIYQIRVAAGRRLDRSEGVHRGFYQRQSVSITLESKRRITAFTYVSERPRPDRLPSARYLGLIVNGARYHKLPKEWIDHLSGWPLATDERVERQATLF